MLRDGKFIREELPKIGSHWIPKHKEEQATPEERFAQDVLLGVNNSQFSILSKVLGRMLRL